MKLHHFIAVVLVFMFAGVSSGYAQQTAEQLYQAGLYKEEIEGQVDAAIKIYETIINQYPENRPVAAKTQLHIGLCYEKLGNAEARKAYESVVRDYADQAEPTKMARERLSVLVGGTGLTKRRTEVAMRQIWVAGEDLIGGISPDGRYVIFEMYDKGDLWLRDLQSGEQKQITREGSMVENTFSPGIVAVSPDSRQIAYIWWARNHLELRLSALDGTSMRVLHSGQEGQNMNVSAWMPDGQGILAVSYDSKDMNFRRHIISLPEGTIRNIGKPESGKMTWGYPSPDGRYIAYDLKNDIFIYDTLTEQDSVLVRNPAVDVVTGWAPDKSGILFVSNRSGTRDLYLQRIRNSQPYGDPEVLRLNLISYPSLGITKDGRLFYIENTGGYKSFIVNVNEQTGRLAGTPSLADPDYSELFYPSWSTDGKLFYYFLIKRGSDKQSKVLVIRNEETRETREISPDPKLWWYRPLLSPDGRKFAVTGQDRKDNFGIFAIDSDSGTVTQLAKIRGGNEATDPNQNWSPDGKAIFYKLRSPEKKDVFLIRRKDLTSGEEKEIYSGFNPSEMKISPDGTRFVYYRSDKPTNSYVYGILDINSGKELVLWRVPEIETAGGISSFLWTPDGMHVFVARNLKQGSELWRFPATGGTGEKIHFFPEESWGFVMHPGGKQIAFTLDKMNYELWVLENFLPKEESINKQK